MKFMDPETFLLSTETAKRLYFETAANLPIIDYHSHVNPREIFEDTAYENITQAWLREDHYKWRAMRACGVGERFIALGGGASDEERFCAYASCIPALAGNPLYHWSHIELRSYFGINEPLSAHNAREIYGTANERLKDMSARRIIRDSNVETLCTTDDPADDLRWHIELNKSDGFDVRVLPDFRPEKALAEESPGFGDYLDKLSAASGVEINGTKSLQEALSRRLDFFVSLGCRTGDQSMDSMPVEADGFKLRMLKFLAREYHRCGIVMKLRLGVSRNVRGRMFGRYGADMGFDVIGNPVDTGALARFLDSLDREDCLPRTVIYSLSPGDDAVICALCGAYGGRVQQGSAWWYNDTLPGIKRQLETYASMLPLGCFTGFPTDSRSFLSYTRHEYFRRILCDFVGAMAERGEFTADGSTLEKLITDICYNNPKSFFGF